MGFEYPPACRGDTVDVLHGRDVPDPYRWLEDPDSLETAAWVDKQNLVTQSYLSAADHLRPSYHSTIKNLLNYDRYSAAWKSGPYFYYYHRVALANQARIMQADSVDGEPRVFLDPNNMSNDGTVSLATVEWSRNGKYLAYGVHRGGSDWEEIRVMNCDTVTPQPELLEWAKFTSLAWTRDEKGFYYARYPTPSSLSGADKEKRGTETDQAVNQSIYYHVVGTPQDQDRMVFTDETNPKRMYGMSVTLDGAYLLIYASEDCSPKNQLWYVDLSSYFGSESAGIVKYIGEEFDSQFTYLANDEKTFFLSTNWKASKNRVIVASLDGKLEDCEELIPEQPDRVISSVTAVNVNQLAIVFMKDAHDQLAIHSMKTGEQVYEVDLPDIGSVGVVGDRDHDFLMYDFSSFVNPGTVYYVDLTTPADGTRIFRKMSPPGFDPSQYSTRQEFFTSKDGKTRVPMFIMGRREVLEAEAPQEQPCLLYGYGGFMISLTPNYSGRWSSWMECIGGIVVVANIRGGAEYGSEWHDDGIIDKKQNVFDDFQWAAKHLCNNLRLTQPKSLLIMGGSNGGLLVGACINQAPELYGAAVAQVGVHDIFRFHKFTIGSAWVSDFGDPDNPEHFAHQVEFSPLHNVFNPDERGVPYPPLLLTTGDHDDRVVPLHTLKYGAELQYRAGKSELQGGNPILLRIDVKAGHGAGKPTSKVIEEICDTLLFAALALKIPGISK